MRTKFPMIVTLSQTPKNNQRVKITVMPPRKLAAMEAHIPYIPEKIIAADEFVVALLESLCKIKQRYKEKQFAKSKLDSSLLGCLRAEIQVNEEVLEKLKSKNSEKDAEIACLRQELHDFDFRNAILVEKTRQESLVRKNARIMNIAMFEDTFKNASRSIHDFAKPVISLMKASGWDLDLAADSIESGVVYFKRSDKKFAFEAFIARRMFHGMSLKSHNVDDILMVNDPLHYLIENPHSEFADFCRKKYLFVTHPVMELSFLGNLDQRMFVLSGKHPRTPFYQIFTRMAKWVWVLQQIATSIDLKTKIFAVNRGCQFSDIYMERIDKKGEGTADLDERHSSCKVEFMVMPGFKVGDTVVKAQVYVSEVRPSHGTY
ncbi:hypothetical protein K2173_016680 [Erythroxylum novogranatense]|uniref:DUF641 domain-containing protein n=1 Tax=Erythroxylum novogranatense TaxID=1862640 RepID=A0AAV8SGZ6_9ROSI|nr:hypothetical protein K2173_016680 [Erythroxylum novogranatense]